MGCFEVMEGGLEGCTKEQGGGCGISSAHLLWRGGVPKSSCPTQGCSTPMDQPIQPQVSLSVGLGFGDLRCPQPLGTASSRGQWHQGWGMRGLFSHLLGLVLLGAPRLLAGAVGHRKKRSEGFQPSAAPREDESLRPSTTPIFGVGGKVSLLFGSRSSSSTPSRPSQARPTASFLAGSTGRALP